MTSLSPLLYVALGGALGAVLRYGLSGVAHHFLGEGFPWGTLAANLVGCFAIGVLWALAERGTFSPGTTAFVFTGLVGAFTTFSTYSLETVNLLRDGRVGLGLLNVLASTLCGVLLVLAGFACARLFLRPNAPGAMP